MVPLHKSVVVENHSDDSLGTPQSRYVANAFVSLGGYYVTGIASSLKANPQRARDLFAYAASYFGDAAGKPHHRRYFSAGQIAGSR